MWACPFRALGYRTANDTLKRGAANLSDLNAGCQANCSDINLAHVFCIMWIRNREATWNRVLFASVLGGLVDCFQRCHPQQGHPSFALLWKCWKCKKYTCADDNDILKWKHFILLPPQTQGKKSTVKQKQGSLYSVWNERVGPDLMSIRNHWSKRETYLPAVLTRAPAWNQAGDRCLWPLSQVACTLVIPNVVSAKWRAGLGNRQGPFSSFIPLCRPQLLISWATSPYRRLLDFGISLVEELVKDAESGPHPRGLGSQWSLSTTVMRDGSGLAEVTVDVTVVLQRMCKELESQQEPGEEDNNIFLFLKRKWWWPWQP